MALINLQNISLSHGTKHLLDSINLLIQEEDKIALLGRNGAGKSTLMKIIAGLRDADEGTVHRGNHVKTAILSQEVPQDMHGKVFDIISAGYDAADARKDDEKERHSETKRVLSLIEIEGELEFSALSAGMKRRVLLGRALVTNPDLLLLDEPTNHLDLDAIMWLENFLLRYEKALFFVTHDRRFLQKVAKRIIELDRGQLSDWSCDYLTFLKRKEEQLIAEEKQNLNFDKKLAEEEAWIRQGIKARRTRNEGRVRALEKMREERKNRRELKGTASIEIQSAERSGKRVIEAEEISFAYEDKTIVSDFSTTILRGDKVGIIGPNGCGKSTLIKLLLGELRPQSGEVKSGTKLEILYFDQLRNQLDEDKTVKDAVADGLEMISFNGQTKHVFGYLQEFLFTPDEAKQYVSTLSGGERNRLLLAKLFTKPGNVLVLDEPTNDLDIETVELLEELLVNFEGTLILVSHDRQFLNNVVTSTLGFTESGTLIENAGGYDEWRAIVDMAKKPVKEKKTREKKAREKTKLSFKEEKELAALPEEIEELEARKDELCSLLADPELYKNEATKVTAYKSELDESELKLEAMYGRWDELEEMRERFSK